MSAIPVRILESELVCLARLPGSCPVLKLRGRRIVDQAVECLVIRLEACVHCSRFHRARLALFVKLLRFDPKLVSKSSVFQGWLNAFCGGRNVFLQ